MAIEIFSTVQLMAFVVLCFAGAMECDGSKAAEFGLDKAVNLPPTAVASASRSGGVAPLTVSFAGTNSFDPDQNPITYRWDFGDGTAISTSANPRHNYSAAGLYTARLTVSDGTNISTPASINISVANGASGLVAAYGFEEGAGANVADTSGNDNDGSITAASWNNGGRFGKALSFDGSNSVVTVNHSSSLDMTAAITLEVWVNPSSIGNAWASIFCKETDTWYLKGSTPQVGAPAFGGIFARTNVYGSGALPPNTWTYLAATYDGAIMKFYVNGVLANSQPQTGALRSSVGALGIGGSSIPYGSGSHFWSGLIDEVRIYNRALSAAEVQTDMNTPIVGTTSRPAAPTNLRIVTSDAPPFVPPTLYFLLSAVDSYQDPKLRSVATRVSQAIKMRESFTNASGLFSYLESIFLTNSLCKTAWIQAACSEIASKSHDVDTFLFYFSGNGVRLQNPTKQGDRFMLSPYDFQSGPLRNGITIRQLSEWTDKIKAGRHLFIFDCADALFALNDYSWLLTQQKPTLGSLTNRSVCVLASGGGLGKDRYSTEFTDQLLMGLGGSADLDEDRVVSSQELEGFLHIRLAQIGKEAPHTFSVGQAFPVARGDPRSTKELIGFGASLKPVPPSVYIIYPQPSAVTKNAYAKERDIDVGAFISGNRPLVHALVNSNTVAVDEQNVISSRVRLETGTNEIVIYAKDVDGRAGSKTLLVVYEPNEPADTGMDRQTISFATGVPLEFKGQDSIYVNGNQVHVSPAGNDGRAMHFLGKETRLVSGLNWIERGAGSGGQKYPYWYDGSQLRNYQMPYSQSYAIVVAIDDYDRLKDPDRRGPTGFQGLSNMVQNAQALVGVLQTLGFPKDHIFELYDTNATSGAITESLQRFWEGKRSIRADRLFFYFGGHGTTNAKSPCLVTYSFDPDDPTRSGFLMGDIIGRHFENVAARHLIVAIDACYAGLALPQYRFLGKASDLKRRKELKAISIIQAETEKAARNILLSGTAEQWAVWEQGGIFTQALVAGLRGDADLNGDGIIEFDELCLFVKDDVRSTAREMGEDQEPKQWKADRLGTGGVVFIRDGVRFGEGL